jgi:alpha-D-ribose 1-methylphosphonate 5-triphosphate diphosphatase
MTFTNARLVLPTEVRNGSLRVEHGRIADLSPGPSNALAAIDLEGDFLLPGLVEIHTDNLERHLMPRPKVHWAELPALLAHDAEIAAAGITTVFDALGVGATDYDSPRSSAWDGVLETLDMCADKQLLRAEHHLHVRCELPAHNAVELFAPFHEHPRLGLISIMDHTPGQRQWEDLEHARIYYTGKKGWDQDKFERQVAHAIELQLRHAAPNRRYFVDYCQAHGIALASHDDTTEAQVDEAHADGASISEFPTTEQAARAARVRAMHTVMGAPNVVRGGSHSGNVSASRLAGLGLLDILSSDYVPGSLLTGTLRLVHDGLLSLPQAVATVTHNPARAMGMDDRGQLAVGLRADLVQVRLVEVADGNWHAVVRAVWREGQRVH